MNSIKKNFIYNIVYQLLIFIIPLITVPYISRVLGADGVGKYSYTYSIVYYFMLFAMLGFNNYGNRSIAKVRDNKQKLSKTFKEIYLTQLIISFLMIILYVIFSISFNHENKTIFFIQILFVVSCMFDINWFYFGIEKFKLTITRNIIIKILSLILLFVFVNDSNDVCVYTLILAGSTLLSQMLLWPFLKKNIFNVKVSFKDITKHFIPCLKLFLPVIAITIYKVMDKTMLGILTNMSEVGFYENSEKIINVPNAIIAALGTVMLPRMSNMYANNEHVKSKVLIHKSMKFIMFLSFAMTFGLISISNDFSVIFFGSEFTKSGILIIYLAITIIFISWGNVLRTQYLIPMEYDKKYIISAFIGAIVNFVINLILIPKYSSIGACIGTIFAEFSVICYQTLSIRKELPVKKYFIEIIPFFVKAIIMFIIIYSLKYIEMPSVFRIVLQVMAGIIIYFILNIKYINSIVNFKNIFKRGIKNINKCI